MRDVEVRTFSWWEEARELILVQHLATLASLYKYYKLDYVYPKERINDCWEKVLLNQCEPRQ
jgi:hypothetical protein